MKPDIADPAKATSVRQVADIQRKLRAAGFYSGDVTGICDEATQQASVNYLRSSGAPPIAAPRPIDRIVPVVELPTSEPDYNCPPRCQQCGVCHRGECPPLPETELPAVE